MRNEESVLFLHKKLRGGVWTVLTSCIIYSRQHASFLCPGNLSHSSRSVDQLPKFNAFCIQCHEIYLRVFNGTFWLVWPHPFPHPGQYVRLRGAPLAVSPQRGSGCPHTQSWLLRRPLTLGVNFTFPVTAFCFFAAPLSVWASSLFQGPVFVKRHMVCHR